MYVLFTDELLLLVSKDLLPTAANGAMYRLRTPPK